MIPAPTPLQAKKEKEKEVSAIWMRSGEFVPEGKKI